MQHFIWTNEDAVKFDSADRLDRIELVGHALGWVAWQAASMTSLALASHQPHDSRATKSLAFCATSLVLEV